MSLAEAPSAATRHLLVVDDDDRIRELLKAFLSREGFRVTVAPGGAAPASCSRGSTSIWRCST